MDRPQPSNIDIRNKLRVNCPSVFQQAGFHQIDFGSVFLNPASEGFVAQTENVASDIRDIFNNIDNIITPETVTAIADAISYIGKDLVETLTGYCISRFNTYISTDYALSLLGTYTKSTAAYTAQYTKNPVLMMEELTQNSEDLTKGKQESESKNNILAIIEKVNSILSVVMKKLKKIMDEIQPYTTELRKYVIYGPDYIESELISLYKVYLNKGLAIIDKYIGLVLTEINNIIDDNALISGKFAAQQINAMQERLLKQNMDTANKTISKGKMKAMSEANKAIMNLLAVIGA